MLAGLMPEDAEVLGLLALMEIQASRHQARTGPDGAVIPLTEQDRARWDHLLIRQGLDALARAEALGPKVGDVGPMCCKPPSPPATLARAGPPIPTGRASPRSMTGCASRRPRRCRPPQQESRSALMPLCESYWYPLYAYVRRRGYPR